MSLDQYEQSRQLGQPATLYLFRYGVGVSDYHAFTDVAAAITHDGKTYAPEAIGRDAIRSSGTLDKSALQVVVPITNPVAALFLVYPPTQVVTLTIFQGHIDDPDAEFTACWVGRVLNCARENSQAVLTCEEAATSMRRPGLRLNYQYQCPHALYSQGDFKCNADMAAATISRAIVSATGSQLTMPAGWDSVHPAAKYVSGMVSWTNAGNTEFRTILRVSSDGTVLQTSGLLRGLTPGATVDMILGCNHRGDLEDGDCLNLHVTAGSGSPPTPNIANYGGQLWIPTKNPMGPASPFV